METSMSPREFIQRFHLPQLVRIDLGEQTSAGPKQQVKIAAGSNKRPASGGRLEQRDPGWTYSPGSHTIGQSVQRLGPAGGLADDAGDQCRSLVLPGGGANPAPAAGPASLRMLPRIKLQARPRKTLAAAGLAPQCSRPELDGKAFARPTAGPAGGVQDSAGRSGADSGEPTADIKLMPPCRRPTLAKLQLEQPFLLYKAYRKLEVCAYARDSNNQLNDKSGDPVHFPHNYQGWFSISAKALDPGHQIGSFGSENQTARGVNSAAELASIDLVCQSASQVFLTRDELVAYKLPDQLSSATRLRNNQILAVPLAIHLESELPAASQKSASKGKGATDGKSPDSATNGSISYLKQVVIGAGQALKICGIYEDVLPPISAAGTDNNSSSSSNRGTQFDVVGRSAMVAPSRFPDDHHYPYQQIVAANQAQFRPAPFQHHARLNQLNHRNEFPNQIPYKSAQRQVGRSGGPVMDARLDQVGRQQRKGNADGLIYTIQGSQFQVDQRRQLDSVPSALMAGPRWMNSAADKAPKNSTPSVATQVGVQSRRYARCIVLNDHSLDRLTGCSIDADKSQQFASLSPGPSRSDRNEPVQEEIEVLIPLNQTGRFYLCATIQTIADELQCYDCTSRLGASQMVFRLSQIVYLLNVNKRLVLEQDKNRWSSSFKLPLHVELVIGPRPSSFSPTMFGSSSTMESYFSVESNVGGHSLACTYNKSQVDPRSKVLEANQTTNKQQRADADRLGPHGATDRSLTGSPVCSCPQRLAASGAGGLSWFSGLFQLESVARRDVLLACTIKQDPLVHLDLSRQIRASEWRSTLAAKSSSTKLDDLCESLETLLEARATDHKTTLGSSKSSMNRLRACKSLISLNGRRKRKRPNIPRSMLMLPDALGQYRSALIDGATSGRGSHDPLSRLDLQLAELDDDLFGHCGRRQQQGGTLANLADQHTAQDRIILIEFDCHSDNCNGGVKMARTFFEQSLPSSSIPDLVVSRLSHCQRYSSLWERQLKLSNASLSRDFDLCERQLAGMLTQPDESNRAALGLRQAKLQPETDNSNPETETQRQLSGPTSLMFIKERSIGQSDGQQTSSTRSQSSQLTSTTSNSTASSRSSSGVSSSGEHRRRQSANVGSDGGQYLSASLVAGGGASRSSLLFQAGSPATPAGLDSEGVPRFEQHVNEQRAAEPSGRVTIAANETEDEAAKTTRSVAAASGGSRLLRLVQRVLPKNWPASVGVVERPSSGQRNAAQTTVEPPGGDSGGRQQQRLMEELNGRFGGRRLAVGDVDDDKWSKPALADVGRLARSEGADSSSAGRVGENQGASGCQTEPGSDSKRLVTTLMNAQKIHQRLRQGDSLRHLPGELLTRMLRADNECIGVRNVTQRDESSDQNEADEDDDDADENESDVRSCKSVGPSSSHLYESLERLNESLAMAPNGRRFKREREEAELRPTDKTSASQLIGRRRLAKLRCDRLETALVGSAHTRDESCLECRLAPRSGLGNERPKLEARHEHEAQPQHGQGARLRRVGSDEQDFDGRRRSTGRGAAVTERYSNNHANNNGGGGGSGGNNCDNDHRRDEHDGRQSGVQLEKPTSVGRPEASAKRSQKSRPISSWRQKLVASVSGAAAGQQRDSSSCNRPGHLKELFGHRQRLDREFNVSATAAADESDELELGWRLNSSSLSSQLDGSRAGSSDDLDLEPVSIEACDHNNHHHSHRGGRDGHYGEHDGGDGDNLEHDSKWNCSMASCSPTSTIGRSHSSCSSLDEAGRRQRPRRVGSCRRTMAPAYDGADGDPPQRWPTGRNNDAERVRIGSASSEDNDEIRRRQSRQAKELYVNLSISQQAGEIAGAGGSPDSQLASRKSRLIGRMERKLAKLRGRCGPDDSQRGKSVLSGQTQRAIDEEPAKPETLLEQQLAQDTSSSDCLSPSSWSVSSLSGDPAAKTSPPPATNDNHSKESTAGVDLAGAKAVAILAARPVASSNRTSSTWPKLNHENVNDDDDDDDDDDANNNCDGGEKRAQAMSATESQTEPPPPVHYDYHF